MNFVSDIYFPKHFFPFFLFDIFLMCFGFSQDFYLLLSSLAYEKMILHFAILVETSDYQRDSSFERP